MLAVVCSVLLRPASCQVVEDVLHNHGAATMSAATFLAGITLGQIVQVAVALLVAQVVFWLFRQRAYRHRLSRSGVTVIPFGLLGPIPSLRRNMHRLYDWQSDFLRQDRTVAMMMPFWAGNALIVTTDPRNIEHFLKTNWRNYNKPAIVRRRILELLGDGIFRLNHGACIRASPSVLGGWLARAALAARGYPCTR